MAHLLQPVQNHAGGCNAHATSDATTFCNWFGSGVSLVLGFPVGAGDHAGYLSGTRVAGVYEKLVGHKSLSSEKKVKSQLGQHSHRLNLKTFCINAREWS